MNVQYPYTSDMHISSIYSLDTRQYWSGKNKWVTLHLINFDPIAFTGTLQRITMDLIEQVFRIKSYDLSLPTAVR